MRRIFFVAALVLLSATIRAQSPPSTVDICNAITGFLNAVNKGTVSKAIGKLYQSNKVGNMEIREYHSLQGFPGAVRTIIYDTNMINRMRFVEVLLATEVVKEQRIKGQMEDALNFYIVQLENCLNPLKYETNADRAPGHEFTASFNLTLPETGTLFRQPDFLQAQLYLTHKKNADDTFTNELYLTFRRI